MAMCVQSGSLFLMGAGMVIKGESAVVTVSHGGVGVARVGLQSAVASPERCDWLHPCQGRV